MTIEENCLFALCRAGLTGILPAEKPDNQTIIDALNLAKIFMVGAMAAEGALRLPDLPKNIQTEAKRAIANAQYMETSQFVALDELEKRFAEREIDFCWLKGIRTRRLYPLPYMREMCDIDVLVRLEQWDAACEVMTECGYDRAVDREIELHAAFYRNDAMVELHRHLLSIDNGRYVARFSDAWQMLTPDDNKNSWNLSPADRYLYYFIHMEKHVGFEKFSPRMLADIYVFRKFGPAIDRDEFQKNARLAGLDGFAANMEALTDIVFGNMPPDPERAQLLDYLMSLARITDKETDYRFARRWLLHNAAPLGILRQFFAPRKLLLTRYGCDSLIKSELKWLLRALHNYTMYLSMFVKCLASIPRARRRRLNTGQKRLFTL